MEFVGSLLISCSEFGGRIVERSVLMVICMLSARSSRSWIDLHVLILHSIPSISIGCCLTLTKGNQIEALSGSRLRPKKMWVGTAFGVGNMSEAATSASIK